MIRYGILNTSRIVERFVKAVNLSKNGEVVAIGSRNINKAKEMANKLGIKKYYGSYEEIYMDPEVDVVYISTINFAHYENALMCLKHGKHVLLEKPFTLTANEAKELFRYAKEKNLFLMEAQKQVFIPLNIKIREFIRNEEKIGKVALIDFKNYIPSNITNWIHNKEKGGGLLYAHATYGIEYVQFMMDTTITSLCGLGSKAKDDTADDQCVMVFNTNGVLSTNTITSRAKIPMYALIIGEKGEIYVENYYRPDKIIIRYYDGRGEEIITMPFENEMVFEVDHVNECLEKGLITSPVMSEEITINATMVLEEIQKNYFN